MRKLDEKQSIYMQNIVSVIASILRLDVTLVDKNLKRVAGTGRYFDKINTSVPCNSSFDLVLKTGQQMVISDVGKGVCKTCAMRENCQEKAHVCCPIFIDNKPIAVLGLIAFNEEQKERLLSMLEDYKDFLSHICNLIAIKIREDEIVNQMVIINGQLNSIMETVKEGMMLVDREGKVTYCNKAVENILDTRLTFLVDRYLNEIFNGSEVAWDIDLQKGFTSRELVRVERGKRCVCITSCNTVSTEDRFLGAVLTFNAERYWNELIGEYAGEYVNQSFNTIKGNSTILMECKRQAYLAAKSNSTVLITGETGTGKDLLARAIHSSSSRKEKPFIVINCGAIPDNLLESELFGYEQGAFTGAGKGGKPGKFQIADGGTIFLDEVGDMPFFLQVKLLRVLQDGYIERVGGVNKIQVDVRIIAATNRNLEYMVEHGEFREDLYYRLNVIPLEMPPLRERQGDIDILMNYFLDKYASMLHKEGIKFCNEALSLLRVYSWPGNVRELENTIEYAVNMAQGKTIKLDNLPKRLHNNIREHSEKVTPLWQLEKNELEKALRQYGNSAEAKKKIAQALNVSVATVYRKLKQYKLL